MKYRINKYYKSYKHHIKHINSYKNNIRSHKKSNTYYQKHLNFEIHIFFANAFQTTLPPQKRSNIFPRPLARIAGGTSLCNTKQKHCIISHNLFATP